MLHLIVCIHSQYSPYGRAGYVSNQIQSPYAPRFQQMHLDEQTFGNEQDQQQQFDQGMEQQNDMEQGMEQGMNYDMNEDMNQGMEQGVEQDMGMEQNMDQGMEGQMNYNENIENDYPAMLEQPEVPTMLPSKNMISDDKMYAHTNEQQDASQLKDFTKSVRSARSAAEQLEQISNTKSAQRAAREAALQAQQDNVLPPLSSSSDNIRESPRPPMIRTSGPPCTHQNCENPTILNPAQVAKFRQPKEEVDKLALALQAVKVNKISNIWVLVVFHIFICY
jgi:hypothetical protein